MAKKPKVKKKHQKLSDLYKVEGDKLVKNVKSCPKCGDGIFLAQHKNRQTCGKCNYTEFSSKK